uniref:Uncharacterized protein n=1 Tax=Glossina brevipalpis TaxID=37001 RepID=A0A1A9WYL0_9MUSC
MKINTATKSWCTPGSRKTGGKLSISISFDTFPNGTDEASDADCNNPLPLNSSINSLSSAISDNLPLFPALKISYSERLKRGSVFIPKLTLVCSGLS